MKDVVDTDSKFKKIYWLKNFETGENLTFSENKVTEDQLKEYNEKGYNIYQTVNTFIGSKRQIKNLAEIKSCFIDIDYPEITNNNLDDSQRAEFIKLKFTEVQNNLKKIKELYDIKPSVINLTYKGFHILFNYGSGCFLIDEKIHQEINNKLIEILGGDQNAKDLARVYKVPGFYDWKGGKRGKIKTLLETHNSFISKEIIENKFLFSFKERTSDTLSKKTESHIKKENTKLKNIEKINNINSFEFIKRLNDIFLKELNDLRIKEPTIFHLNEETILEILNKLKYEKINEFKYSLFESDGIRKTSGLFIEKNATTFEINDYSKKTRRGNYNFLKNWVLLDLEFDYNLFSKILYKSTGLALNSNLENNTEVDFKLLADRINNKVKVELNDFNKELFLDYSSEKFKQIDAKAKVILLSLLTVIKQLKITEYTNENNQKEYYYRVEWNTFLDFLGESKDKSNRKKLKKELLKILLYCSDNSFPFTKTLVDNTGRVDNVTIFEKIFSLGNNNSSKIFHRGIKDFFLIKPLINNDFNFSKSIGYYNQNIISAKLKDEVKDLTLFIDWLFKNTEKTIAFFTFKEIFERIGLNSTERVNLRTLEKHLKKISTLGFIKEYTIDKDAKQIKVFKFKKAIES